MSKGETHGLLQFDEKVLEKLFIGKLRDEFKTVVDAIVLLEMMKPDNVHYFVPGYYMLHNTMLDMLHANVNDVGFAGRIYAYADRKMIMIDPGGSSMKGYVLSRFDETEGLITQMVGISKKLKGTQVVWR